MANVKSATLRPNAYKVLSLLKEQKKPLSAYEILDLLRSEGFHAPATIYRSLDALVKNGLIKKIQTYSRYVYVQDEAQTELIVSLSICSSCGRVFHASSPELQKDINKIGLTSLGRVDQVTIEISGMCSECLKNPSLANLNNET